jgi:hypothetical protein
MHRKTDTQEFDIPKDDIECWERYPKHRWVYELSRLLDAQSIKWSPYEVDTLPNRELNIELFSRKTLVRQPGYIYMKKSEGRHMFTEMYITKGEIKLMRHIDPVTKEELPSLIGEVELRLSAFVTLYFQKFTGVVGVETYSNEIFRIQLRPHVDISLEANQEVVKLAKRIYKKSDVTAVGLTDRATHETLAS